MRNDGRTTGADRPGVAADLDAGTALSGMPVGPVASAERLVGLDALRGFALLGILMVNIWLFANPLITLLEPFDGDAIRAAWEAAGGLGGFLGTAAFADLAAALLRDVVFTSKFISLFSMMFGAGIALQAMRFAARGRPFGRFLFARLLVLGAIGFVHGFFIWYGDILLTYAVFGLSMILIVRLGTIGLRRLAIGLFVGSTLLMSTCMALGIAFQPEFPQPSAEELARPPIELVTMVAQGQPFHPAYAEAERLAYGSGTYLEQLVVRSVTFLGALVQFSLAYAPHIVMMFTIGALLLRLGFFDAAGASMRSRVLRICLPLGLLLESARAACNLLGHVGDEPGWLIVAALLSEPGSVVLCLGFAALVVQFAQGARTGLRRAIAEQLAAVGRMALTNYLLQSIIATTIFYSFGLGLFGGVPLWSMPLFALAIWGLEFAWSRPLLAMIGRGPMERLWRALSYPLARLMTPPSAGANATTRED